MLAMRPIDSITARAIHDFLGRLPKGVRLEQALLYGSRARGDYSSESDADLALVLPERAGDWRLLWDLGGIAYEVYLETGVLIQPVPIASSDWAHPETFSSPGFLRNVALEGIPV